MYLLFPSLRAGLQYDNNGLLKGNCSVFLAVPLSSPFFLSLTPIFLCAALQPVFYYFVSIFLVVGGGERVWEVYGGRAEDGGQLGVPCQAGGVHVLLQDVSDNVLSFTPPNILHNGYLVLIIRHNT